MGFIGGGKSRPPSESKRQPSGLRFEASTWKNGLASPKGDLQICSEVGNSRGSVQCLHYQGEMGQPGSGTVA